MYWHDKNCMFVRFSENIQLACWLPNKQQAGRKRRLENTIGALFAALTHVTGTCS